MKIEVLKAIEVLLEYLAEKIKEEEEIEVSKNILKQTPDFHIIRNKDECDYCGNKTFFIDNVMLTSNPPQQKQTCTECGKIRFAKL